MKANQIQDDADVTLSSVTKCKTDSSSMVFYQNLGQGTYSNTHHKEREFDENKNRICDLHHYDRDTRIDFPGAILAIKNSQQERSDAETAANSEPTGHIGKKRKKKKKRIAKQRVDNTTEQPYFSSAEREDSVSKISHGNFNNHNDGTFTSTNSKVSLLKNGRHKIREKSSNILPPLRKRKKKVTFDVSSEENLGYEHSYTELATKPSENKIERDKFSRHVSSSTVAFGDGYIIFSAIKQKQHLQQQTIFSKDEKFCKMSQSSNGDSLHAINQADKSSSKISEDTLDTISVNDVSAKNGFSSGSSFIIKEPWDLQVGSPLQDGYHSDIEDQNAEKQNSNGSAGMNENMDLNSSKVDYRELALKLAMEYDKPKVRERKKQYCDYVLLHESSDTDFFHCQDRVVFEKELNEQGIDIIRTEIGKYTYLELYCPFNRLCEEAENVFLQMPLAGFCLKDGHSSSLSSCLNMINGESEPAFVTLPFCNSVLELFEGIDDHQTFFRPALRSMLTHNILQTIKLKSCEEACEEGVKNVAALSSLLHSGAYKDAYILHERSYLDPSFPFDYEKLEQNQPPMPRKQHKNRFKDRRKELHDLWLTWYRFQPLTKVKDYFGEKIAFYFAWLGMLVTSLWIPMILGVTVSFYGLFSAYNENPTGFSKISMDQIKELSARALDNKITPYFALLICLWGTVFLEIWKRKSAELAYKWDVDDFEYQEPNRPQFYGTKNVKDPFSGTFEPFYPPLRKICKSLGSMSVIIFMIFLVLGSVVSVITVKVVSRVDWFSGNRGSFISSLTSSVLNSISILLLGKVYRSVATALTCWENHRTQTQYEDALVLKLFGFQFVNSYSSLYYIAFFRERTSSGIFDKGPKYTDDCGNTNDCMSLLSLQVAVLMVMKPLPKFLTDFVIPKVKQLFRSVYAHCKRSTVGVNECTNSNDDPDTEYELYLESERSKPPLISFTLSEYTEKVIEYGYLMLFAAAFPLAPLIALVTNLIDLRVDARRLLWLNRRPVAERAQDIGMWYTILEFLNYVGVVTNAFIVGLTSNFGRSYTTMTVADKNGNSTVGTQDLTVTSYANLWIVIAFQNIVLAVKFFVAYVIPDVPDHVFRAQKKEKQEVERLLAKAGFRKGPKKTIAPASSSSSSGRRRGQDDWRRGSDTTFSGSHETSGTENGRRQTDVLKFRKSGSSVSA